MYSYPPLAVRPVPSKPIPIIVGGGVDAAVRRAARHADGFFSNASPQRFVQQVRVARDEMQRIDRDPDSFRWIYYGVMYPGDTTEIMDSVWHQVRKYSDMEASASRSGLADTPPLTDEMAASLEKRIIGGSTQEIVNTATRIRDEVGVPVEWVARSYFPDLSFEAQVDVAEQLAKEVMPYLPNG
jgi:alkanesulfonate monooxygenase SsuD/methylene tetrahydromethanopterin reductase-like flavin-dependent oxidoreductase (luciferase family)